MSKVMKQLLGGCAAMVLSACTIEDFRGLNKAPEPESASSSSVDVLDSDSERMPRNEMDRSIPHRLVLNGCANSRQDANAWVDSRGNFLDSDVDRHRGMMLWRMGQNLAEVGRYPTPLPEMGVGTSTRVIVAPYCDAGMVPGCDRTEVYVGRAYVDDNPRCSFIYRIIPPDIDTVEMSISVAGPGTVVIEPDRSDALTCVQSVEACTQVVPVTQMTGLAVRVETALGSIGTPEFDDVNSRACQAQPLVAQGNGIYETQVSLDGNATCAFVLPDVNADLNQGTVEVGAQTYVTWNDGTGNQGTCGDGNEGTTCEWVAAPDSVMRFERFIVQQLTTDGMIESVPFRTIWEGNCEVAAADSPDAILDPPLFGDICQVRLSAEGDYPCGDTSEWRIRLFETHPGMPKRERELRDQERLWTAGPGVVYDLEFFGRTKPPASFVWELVDGASIRHLGNGRAVKNADLSCENDICTINLRINDRCVREQVTLFQTYAYRE